MILPSLTEPQIRLAIFLVIFGGMALWELADPWRDMRALKPRRWLANLGIFAVDIALVRIVFPASALGFAALAEASDFGVLRWLGLGGLLAGIAGFLLLDLAIYLQHRVFHRVPVLWRLHRMHHSDTDLDVTSGFRFHPVEILLSMVIKGAVIVALGVPALAVLVFEIVLNGTSLFNHANVRLPPWLERMLRWMVVTPMMHRVHHSVEREETDSNFGFNLPWWDRLFDTYVPEPKAGFDRMTLGLDTLRDPAEQRVDRLVMQPLKANAPETLSPTVP
jgi:sterol desaturase/sphingolipid hydroxylase (fatty acid hydroxylase superfamily)